MNYFSNPILYLFLVDTQFYEYWKAIMKIGRLVTRQQYTMVELKCGYEIIVCRNGEKMLTRKYGLHICNYLHWFIVLCIQQTHLVVISVGSFILRIELHKGQISVLCNSMCWTMFCMYEHIMFFFVKQIHYYFLVLL